MHTYRTEQNRTEHRHRRCGRRRRAGVGDLLFCCVLRCLRLSNCGSSWVRCHMCGVIITVNTCMYYVHSYRVARWASCEVSKLLPTPEKSVIALPNQ